MVISCPDVIFDGDTFNNYHRLAKIKQNFETVMDHFLPFN